MAQDWENSHADLTILGDFSAHLCSCVPTKGHAAPPWLFRIYAFLLHRFAQSAWESSSLYYLPLHLKSSSTTSHSQFQNSVTVLQPAHRSSTRLLQQVSSYNLGEIIIYNFLAAVSPTLQVPRGKQMVYSSLCFLMPTFLTNEKFLSGLMRVKYSVLLIFVFWHPAPSLQGGASQDFWQNRKDHAQVFLKL